MLVRALVLGGAVGYLLAGPLLAVVMAPGSGALGVVAVLAVWAGAGGLLAAVLWLTLEQRRRTAALAAELAALAAAVEQLPGQQAAGLEQATAALKAALETQQHELAGRIDRRVLGLHGVVRELGAGPRP